MPVHPQVFAPFHSEQAPASRRQRSHTIGLERADGRPDTVGVPAWW